MGVRSLLRRIIAPAAVLAIGLMPGTSWATLQITFDQPDFVPTQTNVGNYDPVGGSDTLFEAEALNFPGQPIILNLATDVPGEPGAGAAFVEPTDSDTPFQMLVFTPTLGNFTVFEANPRGDGFFKVIAEDNLGNTFTFDNGGGGFEIEGGNTRFQINSPDGQQITSVTLMVVSGDGIESVRQVRLNVVPEPGTLALAGIGLGAAGFAGLRRRNRRNSA